MLTITKRRSFTPIYESSNEIRLKFDTPFERDLNTNNRWIILSRIIPWDKIVKEIEKNIPEKRTGRLPINGRIMFGSMVIKHVLNIDDRETVDQISENPYLQYFLGYPSFINDKLFDASLMVDFRYKIGFNLMNSINELISLAQVKQIHKEEKKTMIIKMET